ncbi:multidrug transporter EmrE-like cation transporter [Bradyrhizobium sp. USDA 4449]
MSESMAWLILVIAGALDVGWAISMKYAEGYTRVGWSIASFVLLATFVFLLGRALKVLEVGVAYSVWTGIGAAGTFVIGVVRRGLERDEACGHRVGVDGHRRAEAGLELCSHLHQCRDGVHVARGAGLGGGDREF